MCMNETARMLRAVNNAKFKVNEKGVMESVRTLKLVGKLWKPARSLRGHGVRMRVYLQLLNADSPKDVPTLTSRTAAYAVVEAMEDGRMVYSAMRKVGLFNSVVNAAFAAETMFLGDVLDANQVRKPKQTGDQA